MMARGSRGRAPAPSVAAGDNAPRRPPYGWNPHPGGTHDTVLRMVPEGTRILDVGCSTGYLGRALADRGHEVFGLDADAASIAAARPWYRDVRVVDLDEVDELPWSEGSFDVAIAADVLEHLLDPARCLTMLTRYVRDDGLFVLSLPNVAHVSVRLPLLFGRFRYREIGILDRTHLHLYTWATAFELVEASGLRVVRTASGSDRFGGALERSAWLGRILRGLLAYNIVLACRKRDEGNGR